VTWELLVVDNASTDGTADWLERHPLGPITINPENLGFGRAHNQNLRAFRGRHVLFLNPDLEFADGLFSSLVRFLDEHPRHAAVGPVIREGPERRLFPPRRFYPGERVASLAPALPRDEYAWLSGCALALRREALLDLHGFDPDVFLYYEDTDLCLRARRAGAKIGWCRETEVSHIGKQSQVELSGYEREGNLVRGALRFWEKHFPEHDVARIAHFRWLVASIRLALARGVGPPTAESTRNYLRAERDLCGAWLRDHQETRLSKATNTLRALAHQLRLGFGWLRRGWYPMDAA
jgi:GT2 family glycosyltransferase